MLVERYRADTQAPKAVILYGGRADFGLTWATHGATLGWLRLQFSARAWAARTVVTLLLRLGCSGCSILRIAVNRTRFNSIVQPTASNMCAQLRQRETKHVRSALV